MAKSTLSIPYGKTIDGKKAYSLVKEKITADYLSNFKIRAEIEYRNSTLISARGNGFLLSFNFAEEAVEIFLELSIIYSAFKNKILSKIEEELKSIL